MTDENFFSDQELKVIDLYHEEGLSNKETSEEFENLSPQNVYNLRMRIDRKVRKSKNTIERYEEAVKE